MISFRKALQKPRATDHEPPDTVSSGLQDEDPRWTFHVDDNGCEDARNNGSYSGGCNNDAFNSDDSHSGAKYHIDSNSNDVESNNITIAETDCAYPAVLASQPSWIETTVKTTKTRRLWQPGDGDGPNIEPEARVIGVYRWSAWLLYDMFVPLFVRNGQIINMPPFNVRLSDYIAGQLFSLRLQNAVPGEYLATKWPSDFNKMGFPQFARPNRGAPYKVEFGGIWYYAIGVYYRFCGAEGSAEDVASVIDNPQIERNASKLAKLSLKMTCDTEHEARQEPLNKNAMGVDPERCKYLPKNDLSEEMRRRIPLGTPESFRNEEGLVRCHVSPEHIDFNALKSAGSVSLKRKANNEIIKKAEKRMKNCSIVMGNMRSTNGRSTRLANVAEEEERDDDNEDGDGNPMRHLVIRRVHSLPQAGRQDDRSDEDANGTRLLHQDLDQRRKGCGIGPVAEPAEDLNIENPTAATSARLVTATPRISVTSETNIDFLLYLCGPDIKGSTAHLPESMQCLTHDERRLINSLVANPQTGLDKAVVHCLQVANGIIKEHFGMPRG